MGFARRCLHQFSCIGQIEIDELSAIVADSVVVSMGFAVVAAGAVSKTDFVNEACFFQVAQRVVDGCVTDAGQAPACTLKDVAGGGVVIAFLDDLKNRFPLGRQLWLRLFFLLCGFQDGFRLILNRWIVKRG